MNRFSMILRFIFSIKGLTALYLLDGIRLSILGQEPNVIGALIGYLMLISPWIAWRFYAVPAVEKWLDERADSLPVSFRAARLRRRHRDALAAIEDSDMDERSKKQARSEADKTLREKIRDLIKG